MPGIHKGPRFDPQCLLSQMCWDIRAFNPSAFKVENGGKKVKVILI